MNFKTFFFNILNGMATGIVIALIPNAMLGELFKYFAQTYPFFGSLVELLMIFQFCASLFIGICVGQLFKLNGLQTAIISGAAFIGSGAVVFKDKTAVLVGMGDLINMIVTIAISVFIVRLAGNRLGSLNIVILPLIAGIFPGLIGRFTLPYVKEVTGAIGNMVNHFTTLNPLLMCILIGITFALLMASPISLVAIATVISLSGLGSGAANLGIVACCYTFILGSLGVNDKGVNTTLIIGAAKMMMPVYLKNPIIMIPLIINGFVAGLMAYILGVQGTPMSAGFGYTGLVGPINAIKFMEGDFMMNVLKLLTAYLVVPLTVAIIVHFAMKKFVPMYNDETFRFNPET